MEYSVKTGHPEKQRTSCLVIGIFESRKLTGLADRVDKVSDGYLSSIVRKGDIEGKSGQALLLHDVPNLQSDRVLLVGCGKQKEFGEKQFKEAVRHAATNLKKLGCSEAICYLTEINLKDYDPDWQILQSILITEDVFYQFNQFKSKKEKAGPSLKRVIFSVPNRRDLSPGETAVDQGMAIAEGITLTRDLGNTPANVCNPTYLAKEATKLAKKYKSINTAVLDTKEMKALGMGSMLSVAQGSDQPPKLITLQYRGTSAKKKPVVFVGKGITFDTGGNSLKPAASMVGMKYDMCGAATVLGIMKFVAELKLPINVVGVVAAAENMPGGKASRPDDIVTSMAGITIEILNTDAEGRLVLCDALTYSERFNPDVVIDIATLTGACVVALGRHHSAMYSNHQPLADALFEAGQVSGDKCWQMPLTEEYQRQLDSNFADVANIGGPEAGSITAASFLARFTEKYNWAHLDVAGTACRFTGAEKSATGQPVSLLAQFLIDKC